MFKEILFDFSNGIITSIRLDIFLYHIITETKIINLIWKLLKFNIGMHLCIPFLLFNIFPIYYANMFYFIVKMISICFNAIHYIEYIRDNHIYIKTKSNSSFDAIASIIMIFIYQISINSIMYISNHFLYNTILLNGINYIIPVIYHSLYCYSNMWQRLHLDIPKQIKIYEIYWPYYFGYGTVSTLLYYYSDIPYIACVYNLYLLVVISIPFMEKQNLKKILPTRQYCRINMSIFTYISRLIMGVGSIFLTNPNQ